MAAVNALAAAVQQLPANDVLAANAASAATVTQANLLNHIVLPRFISAEAGVDAFAQEMTLLSRLNESVRGSLAWMPANTARLLASFERVHQSTESEDAIHAELNGLRPGATFAMYVRRRNTVFMCHMPARRATDGSVPVVVATFAGQVDAQDVYTSAMDLMVSYLARPLAGLFAFRSSTKRVHFGASTKSGVHLHQLPAECHQFPSFVRDRQYSYPEQVLTVNYSRLLRSREFARQLALLSTDLPIDHHEGSTSDHSYLAHWLLTALADDRTDTTPTAIFPMASKKQRDECIKCDAKQPWFRRSALYTATKLILHHNLLLERGHIVGHLLYKLIMLRFMQHASEPMAEQPAHSMDVDVAAQLMAKLARRLDKLHHQFDRQHRVDATVAQYRDLVCHVEHDVRALIGKLRDKVGEQIDGVQAAAVAAARLSPIAGVELRASAVQRVTRLRKHLEQRQAARANASGAYSLHVKPVKRHYARDQAPEAAAFDTGDTGACFLADCEWFALYVCPVEERLMPTDELAAFAHKYAEHTAAVYQSADKITISRTILTHLKLLAMLDHKVCAAHPMLAEHRPSVDLRWFDQLLLLHRVDMEVAGAVEAYFRGRERAAKHPGLLETQKIADDIFGVRFARHDPDMVALRTELLEDIDGLVEEKRRDWQCERDALELLRAQMNELACLYVVQADGEQAHARHCPRCKLQARIRRAMIKQLECPLPALDTEQWAVIFEFRIPAAVRVLRDALHTFGRCAAPTPSKKKIAGDWHEHPRIGHVAHADAADQCVRLGFSYVQPERMLHVDAAFEQFVLRHARNCVYHADEHAFGEAMSAERLNEVCTLPVEPGSPYAGLQWMVNGTAHTQNQVLARQNECPATLPLAEFRHFGSLRADGSRLQWRQLYAMIECDGLAFEQASVLALCLQTIWEQAAAGEAHAWLRTAHVDGRNGGFVRAMLTAIDRFLDRQRSNWMHPHKLLLAAAIAVRLFELNERKDVVTMNVHVLIKIREIALEWRGRIESVIRTGDHSSSSEERTLRQRLVLAMIAGCITFSVHPGHVFAGDTFRKSDPCVWLQLVITLNNNNALMEADDEADGASSRKSMLDMWLRLVQHVGIRLEPTMRDMSQKHQQLVLDYLHNELVATHASAFKQIYFDPECPQTMVGEVDVDGVRSYVTIDIISGLFLVDGSPIVRLPSEFDAFLLAFFGDRRRKMFGFRLFFVAFRDISRFIANFAATFRLNRYF